MKTVKRILPVTICLFLSLLVAGLANFPGIGYRNLTINTGAQPMCFDCYSSSSVAKLNPIFWLPLSLFKPEVDLQSGGAFRLTFSDPGSAIVHNLILSITGYYFDISLVLIAGLTTIYWLIIGFIPLIVLKVLKLYNHPRKPQ